MLVAWHCPVMKDRVVSRKIVLTNLWLATQISGVKLVTISVGHCDQSIDFERLLVIGFGVGFV